MPGMTGVEVHDPMRRAGADMPVINRLEIEFASFVKSSSRPMERTMKSVLAITIVALLFLAGCLSNKAMTPEELEAYRKSNERYERSKGP